LLSLLFVTYTACLLDWVVTKFVEHSDDCLMNFRRDAKWADLTGIIPEDIKADLTIQAAIGVPFCLSWRGVIEKLKVRGDALSFSKDQCLYWYRKHVGPGFFFFFSLSF